MKTHHAERLKGIASMLNAQKNQLFALVKEAGLAPAEFIWVKKTGEELRNKTLTGDATLGHIQSLQHIPSGYFFDFYFVKECGYYGKLEFSPGTDTRVISYIDFGIRCSYPYLPNKVYIDGTACWTKTIFLFTHWVNRLKDELSAGDLWVATTHTLQTAAVLPDGQEAEKFSDAEIQKLSTSVAEFKQLIHSQATQKHTQEEIEAIHRRLDYLVESANRLGKKDWQLVAIGLVTNIVSSLIVSPETMHALLVGANALFGWAFGQTTMASLH